MAGRNRCGFVLASGEHKGKKCNLGAGHDVVSESNPTATRHRYTPPKERPALDISAIGATVVKVTDSKVMAQHRRTRDVSDRSAENRFADQVTQAGYEAWVESGKPDDWNKSFGLLLSVPEPQVAAFKERIHASARRLGYKAAFGADKPKVDGTVTVALRVTDLPAAETPNAGTATTGPEDIGGGPPPVTETETA